MARKKDSSGQARIEDIRHTGEKRKNIPPSRIAAEGKSPKVGKVRYHYSPHLPPVLRSDPSGAADKLPKLIAEAGKRPLTEEEQRVLAAALRNQEPWLEWATKREQQERGSFKVDPVVLHIHERVSAKAILKVAEREDPQRDLFADPQQDYQQAVQFYQHDVDWANRLILGDSLQVMSSLAQRENLAGKVQMIYMDPPYGIKFASNFQPEVGKRDVKDKEIDLTREPEMVRAFRDTWHLGVHSYLSYLRDRLILAREMLTETGSIFVQISDENLHAVRYLLDELFGPENSRALISFRKTSPLGSGGLASVHDYVLWYSRDPKKCKYRQLYQAKSFGADTTYTLLLEDNGSIRRMTKEERQGLAPFPESAEVLCFDNPRSSGYTPSCFFSFNLNGRVYPPQKYSWKTNATGMERLGRSERLFASESLPYYIRKFEDFSVGELNNSWDDTRGDMEMVYVVQTANKVIERCILMTTEPGDLVLDPTCGSGTTAAVAEQWGRRWIAIDTSRVAVSIARQRLLTAAYEHYRVKGPDNVPSSGFVCKTVPHITLRSIAQNANLDPIFTKHEPLISDKLNACNLALASVTQQVTEAVTLKLAKKVASEGWQAPNDADYRRWLLPGTTRATIERSVANAFAGTKKKASAKQIGKIFEKVPASPTGAAWATWNVPFDTDPDWPRVLQGAVDEFRAVWRLKMNEVNACISANADQEELVDQPETVKGVLRVSGPFTVEGVRPEELSIGEDGLFDGTPNLIDDEPTEDTRGDLSNLRAYLSSMVQYLRADGVTFLGNKNRKFARVEPLFEEATGSVLHAEALWEGDDENGPNTIAIGFGPQYGPVTAEQVEDLIRASKRYDELVIAGFSFAPDATAAVQESQHPKLRVHQAYIRPDISPGMDGLLKETPNSQLFTVFGQPEVAVRKEKDGTFTCELLGVDIYDPVTSTVRSTGASKVSAWFLDSDFDGRCFCITQAFFPDRDAWEQIAKALKDAADPDVFEAFKGTVSVPFNPGKYKRIAVKVIDPRGNEVMTIKQLQD
jgi:adenine-specific DNA-methyltransferase